MSVENTTKVEAAPAKEKVKKPVLQKVFNTADEAKTAAESRTKGPRRPFTCTLGDKTFHVVANNEGRAGGIAFEQCGGQVQEIGKAKRSKAVGVDGILAALGSLPKEEREKIMAQLSKLESGAPTPTAGATVKPQPKK
jgi:hypothetical protein